MPCDCIPLLWRCDGSVDCQEHDDEVDCAPRPCKENELRCERSGECISLHLKCDGYSDCKDGFDEISCDHSKVQNETCKTNQFNCQNGVCIDDKLRCNGHEDCQDGSDEIDCNTSHCPADEFLCETGECINQNWICDGDEDCKGGEDELHCPSVDAECLSIDDPTKVFFCSSGKCIKATWRCDGTRDCVDGEDEKECEPTCPPLHFTCNKGKCIPQQEVCDGKKQCPDGDDEEKCGAREMCSDESKCEHMCVIEGNGAVTCQCRRGYKLAKNGFSAESSKILGGLDNAIGLDYHHEKGLLFWSDIKLDIIKQAYLNGSHISVIMHWGLKSPNGIAVDWIHNLLYWTDSEMSRIEVSQLDGAHSVHPLRQPPFPNHCIESEKKCSHLCLPNQHSYTCTCPYGSLLDQNGVNCIEVQEKFLLVTSEKSIQVLPLEGKVDYILPLDGIQSALGLDWDSNTGFIFWTDIQRHSISRALRNGTEQKDIITSNLRSGLTHPFSLALFENDVYWTDLKEKAIYKASKSSAQPIKLKTETETVLDLRVYHGQRLPIPSSCVSSGGCSHLCLLVPPPKGYVCACPTGIPLLDDGRTCKERPEHSLLVAHRTTIRQVSLEVPYHVDVVLPLPLLKNAVGLDVDQVTNEMYWADSLKPAIGKASLKDFHTSEVLSLGLGSVDDLAVDSIGRKLGPYLYWTDWDRMTIERVDKATGKGRIVIHSGLRGLMEIRAVAASNQQGWNPCAENNGYCSHLCLHRPPQYICACPSIPASEPCSNEPSERVPGLEHAKDPNKPHSKSVSHEKDDSFIGPVLYISIGLVIALLLIVSGVFCCLIRGRNTSLSRMGLLSFANPTYTSSSHTVSSERRPFVSKRVHYDRHQGRVVSVPAESQCSSVEGTSLIHSGSSVMEHSPPVSPSSRKEARDVTSSVVV
ncbi:unnamed protein product [Darwinula stevensoni]|uniref:EGF-like domain-containing protein n=1 Tax=Darwinula stevensoni TaxID=69355 RepID=A0A7R8WYY0_9CRUS|nr:unnamed protein product [Darwinula stevensoni]CAG0879904.1 unnamed protein product [Darwinula stevensoni]